MPFITIMPENKTFEYQPGKSLLELLLEAGFFVDNPCNGKGVCGKCSVRFLDGCLPGVTPNEAQRLSEEELSQGIRMSCAVYPEGNITIEILSKDRHHEVLTGGYVPEFQYEVDLRKILVEIQPPTLENQIPLEDQICQQVGFATGLAHTSIPYTVLKQLSYETGTYTVVLRKGEIIGVEAGDTSKALYGVAIDIGTTTVVCSLIDLYTGKEVDNASMINAQKHYGLDVLTRITYELEHPEDGIANLQKAIVDSINEMIRDMAVRVGIHKEYIYDVTVGANCTMMHMLLGIDALTIGKSPYAPLFTGARRLTSGELGLEIASCGRIYCLPSVSSYIGADIVAGAYVCSLREARNNVLFIDIGTNGEIVLSQKGKLLSCSCAAGPALEGMNISAGMRAAEGAIEDVSIEDGEIKLAVIGNSAPIGICGSGILAAVKELVRCEYIRSNGTFQKTEKLEDGDPRLNHIELDGKKRRFVLVPGDDAGKQKKLLITQEDIRQVQLAKGAILSGFLALLQKVGITMADLDKVMIAGQFGAHLPADSLTGTGILPKEVEDKLVYVGNSSKTGAYMALMSERVKEEMEVLAKEMDYMELSATKNYDRLFSDCMVFRI